VPDRDGEHLLEDGVRVLELSLLVQEHNAFLHAINYELEEVLVLNGLEGLVEKSGVDVLAPEHPVGPQLEEEDTEESKEVSILEVEF